MLAGKALMMILSARSPVSLTSMFTRAGLVTALPLAFGAAFAFYLSDDAAMYLGFAPIILLLVIVGLIVSQLAFVLVKGLQKDLDTIKQSGAVFADYRQNAEWFSVIPFVRNVLHGVLIVCLICAQYSQAATAAVAGIIALELALSLSIAPYSDFVHQRWYTLLLGAKLTLVLLVFGLNSGASAITLKAVSVLSIIVCSLVLIGICIQEIYRIAILINAENEDDLVLEKDIEDDSDVQLPIKKQASV